MRLRWVAVFSFLFTALFFFEYLPPIRWVDIPYDLAGYHYSLEDYAFLGLKSGHFPEWDATIYCGMSLVGNIQTALFYPPLWLTFLASIGRDHLVYSSLEMVVLAHIWLAFLFCFVWLRGKGLHTLACAMGSAVFAYSGYPLQELQHLGLIFAYAWFPVGLWSIDQAVAKRTWRPLWKLAAASALCLLAGYPPTFAVFCACMVTYAIFGAWRWKATLYTVGALAFSLAISMVQLLPVREMLAQKIVMPEYGMGMKQPFFFVSYIIPNFFDFGLNKPVQLNPGGEYLYLGAPALFGLMWLIFGRRSLSGQLPILAVAAVCFVFARNPHDIGWNIVRHFGIFVQIVRSYYFLVGITLAAAALAAAGLDDFLKRGSRSTWGWMAPLAMASLALWAGRQVLLWLPASAGFAAGWAGAVDAAIMLALFAGSLWVLRAERGRRRIWMTVALLVAVGVDYKAFGTSKRVNAIKTNTDEFMASAQFPGMPDEVFRELRAHPEYRVALDAPDLRPADLRHRGLTSPQGDDPLVPAQFFSGLILPTRPVQPSKWTFLLDPANAELLDALGVRYIVTTWNQPYLAQLQASKDYRPVGRLDYYFKTFELLNARPVFRWAGQVQTVAWRAGRRDFVVHSASGGAFRLIEELLPGWRAVVDGRPVAIERWNHTFQSIQVPPGDHTVSFIYRSPGLRIGAAISLAAVLALALIAVVRRGAVMIQVMKIK